MDPVTATILLLMVTALVIGLSGRRIEQSPVAVAPVPAIAPSQSGGGAAGLLVVLGVVVLLIAFVL